MADVCLFGQLKAPERDEWAHQSPLVIPAANAGNPGHAGKFWRPCEQG